MFDVAAVLERNGVTRNVFPPFRFAEPPACVVIEKMCDRNSLTFFEQAKQAGSRYLYDLCDPIRLQEEANRRRGRDVEKAIGLADEILPPPTSVLLSEIVRRHLKAKYRCIPDAVEMNAPQFKEARKHVDNPLLRIGWIGTALNMEHLHLAAGALRQSNRSRPLSNPSKRAYGNEYANGEVAGFDAQPKDWSVSNRILHQEHRNRSM